MSDGSIRQALARVQQLAKCPKGRENKFGGYAYRSLEDINAALKPACAEVGGGYWFDDEILPMACDGDVRWYLRATVTFYAEGCEGTVSAHGYAREEVAKKGMDSAQVTGLASSYARKYAACALFDIDGGEEVDALDNSAPAPATEGQLRDIAELAAEFGQMRGRETADVIKALAACRAMGGASETMGNWTAEQGRVALKVLGGWVDKARKGQ